MLFFINFHCLVQILHPSSHYKHEKQNLNDKTVWEVSTTVRKIPLRETQNSRVFFFNSRVNFMMYQCTCRCVSGHQTGQGSIALPGRVYSPLFLLCRLRECKELCAYYCHTFPSSTAVVRNRLQSIGFFKGRGAGAGSEKIHVSSKSSLIQTRGAPRSHVFLR